MAGHSISLQIIRKLKIGYFSGRSKGFSGGSAVKNSPANAEDIGGVGAIPGWEDPLEEGMATHSTTFACPWGGLSMLSDRVTGCACNGRGKENTCEGSLEPDGEGTYTIFHLSKSALFGLV